MAKRKRIDIVWVIFIILVIFAIGLMGYQKVQYYLTSHVLKSKSLSELKSVRIYPNVSVPFGESLLFSVPDPLVNEFLIAFQERSLYVPNRDTIASREHQWFLELTFQGNEMYQIACYIPSKYGDIIVGELGIFRESNSTSYGHVQSRQLYHWYQKYSHRWLKPADAAGPSPTR